MQSDIPEDLPARLWRGFVPHLGTMNRHVHIALHNEFMAMLHADSDAVIHVQKTGPNSIGIGVKPNVVEAFRRLAHELRFTRSFAGIGDRPVKSRRVPRGIVAGHARAKRESVR